MPRGKACPKCGEQTLHLGTKNRKKVRICSRCEYVGDVDDGGIEFANKSNGNGKSTKKKVKVAKTKTVAPKKKVTKRNVKSSTAPKTKRKTRKPVAA